MDKRSFIAKIVSMVENLTLVRSKGCPQVGVRQKVQRLL